MWQAACRIWDISDNSSASLQGRFPYEFPSYTHSHAASLNASLGATTHPPQVVVLAPASLRDGIWGALHRYSVPQHAAIYGTYGDFAPQSRSTDKSPSEARTLTPALYSSSTAARDLLYPFATNYHGPLDRRRCEFLIPSSLHWL